MQAIKIAQIIITAVRAFLAWRAAADEKKEVKAVKAAESLDAATTRIIEANTRAASKKLDEALSHGSKASEKYALVENLTGWGPSVVRKDS